MTVNPAPAPISGGAAVCEGQTIVLADSATGGMWSSASPGIGSIVGSAGLTIATGVITGIAAGTTMIAYTLPDGCIAVKEVTVDMAPEAITGLTSICLGSTTTLGDLTSGGSWSSSAPSIASVGATGIVTGLAYGTAIISYGAAGTSASGGCPSVTTVTVNALPGTISGSLKVCLGTMDTLTDLPGGGVWGSSNVLVATIGTTSGVVTGTAPGTASISYSLGVGCTVYATVTVQPAPPAISGPTYVCAGHTITLSDPATGGHWSSVSVSVATVGSSTGVVSGISGGAATIRYIPPSSASGCAATYAVAVIAVPAITGVSNICAYGSTITVADSAAGGAWTSSLVGISPTGTVTSYAAGAATIYYTLSDGCFASSTLTVYPLPASIVGSDHVCHGTAVTLTDGTPGGVWSSSVPAVAAVVGSTAPTMTADLSTSAAGTSVIKYTLPTTGCMETVTLTVDASPLAGTISGAADVCVGATISLTNTASGGTWSSSNSHATLVASTSLPPTAAIIGVSAGSDTVNYSVANTCGTATAWKAITIDPLPDAGAINGIDSVCAGSTVALTETVAGGTWSATNANAALGSTGLTMTSVSGVSAGRDTIAYLNANTCGTATTDFVIKINTLPNEGTITGAPNVCIGETDTLTGTPAGGVWSSANGNTLVGSTPLTMTAVVTGVNAGTDTIKYSFVNSCGQAVTGYVVTVVKCDTVTRVGIKPLALKGEPSIWPNPVKDQLTITNAAGSELVMYDLIGRVAYRISIVSDKDVEDISNLANGVYVAEISSVTNGYSTTLVRIKVVKE